MSMNNTKKLIHELSQPQWEANNIANIANKALDNKLAIKLERYWLANRFDMLTVEPVSHQQDMKPAISDKANAALYLLSETEFKLVRDVFETAGWVISHIEMDYNMQEAYVFSYDDNKVVLSIIEHSGFRFTSIYVEKLEWSKTQGCSLGAVAVLPMIKKLTKALS